MSADPFLSVVIPTYNRAAVLRRSVESALSAKAADIEIVISDNASPDSTPEVLASIRDPRMRFWRNPTNVGAERNILGLWRGARGQWVVCLSDDDYLETGALDRIIQILKDNPDIGVMSYGAEAVDADGKRLGRWEEFGEESGRLAAGLDAMRVLVPCSKMFSRITFRREWGDLAATERHIDSMHPQMCVVISALREAPGYYTKEPLVAYTEGNEHFWSYPPDKAVCSRIDLINDLLPGARWRRERKVLIGQVLREVGSFREHARAWRAGTWRRQQRILLSAPEVRRSFRYWRKLLQFLLRPDKSGPETP